MIGAVSGYLLVSSALERLLFQPYHTTTWPALAVRRTRDGVVLGPFSGQQKNTWMDSPNILISPCQCLFQVWEQLHLTNHFLTCHTAYTQTYSLSTVMWCSMWLHCLEDRPTAELDTPLLGAVQLLLSFGLYFFIASWLLLVQWHSLLSKIIWFH